MQLFSVEQQRSQALEAHAASFATYKVQSLHLSFQSFGSCASVVNPVNLSSPDVQVPGNENPSTLISFATKTVNAGQVASKLHVIELGAQPGVVAF